MRRGGWVAFGLVACLIVSAVVVATVKPSQPAQGKQWPTPWAAGEPVFARPARTPPIVGVNYHGIWPGVTEADRTLMLDDFAGAGIQWVRLDISWAMLQPKGPDSYDLSDGVARLDRRIDEIAAHGMKTLLLLYWAPSWSTGTTAKNGVPRDPKEYANAASWVADRYRGKVGAIELWNEPDLSRFLANTSVTTYTGLMKEAYPKIKAVNPDITVVAGAPTYVNTAWYEQMYAAGGAHMFDALGIHPYPGMADAPPTTCDKAYLDKYPCNIGSLVNLMTANGDAAKGIWVTEYGWSAHDNSAYPAPIPAWKRGVTLQQQADYLLQMQSYLTQWPQVNASFWYTDRDTAVGDIHEDNFGLLNRDFTAKPAYYAMRCAASGICGPSQTS